MPLGLRYVHCRMSDLFSMWTVAEPSENIKSAFTDILLVISLHFAALERCFIDHTISALQQTLRPLWHSRAYHGLQTLTFPAVYVCLQPGVLGLNRPAQQTYQDQLAISLLSARMALCSRFTYQCPLYCRLCDDVVLLASWKGIRAWKRYDGRHKRVYGS